MHICALVNKFDNTVFTSNLNIKKFGRVIVLPETEIKHALIKDRLGINPRGVKISIYSEIGTAKRITK